MAHLKKLFLIQIRRYLHLVKILYALKFIHYGFERFTDLRISSIGGGFVIISRWNLWKIFYVTLNSGETDVLLVVGMVFKTAFMAARVAFAKNKRKKYSLFKIGLKDVLIFSSQPTTMTTTTPPPLDEKQNDVKNKKLFKWQIFAAINLKRSKNIHYLLFTWSLRAYELAHG